jgi:hypothetical protein
MPTRVPKTPHVVRMHVMRGPDAAEALTTAERDPRLAKERLGFAIRHAEGGRVVLDLATAVALHASCVVHGDTPGPEDEL